MPRALTVLLVFLCIAGAAQAQTGNIWLEPDTTYFQRDTFFVVTARADANLTGVKALQLDIDIDPAVALPDTVADTGFIELGDMFVDNDSVTFFFQFVSEVPGRLTVDIAILGGTDVVSGPGEIIRFPVNTVGFGESDIVISGYRIRDSLNQVISVTTEDAWLKVCRFVGDVDADNRVDIGDLTYLIAYLFLGGAEPVAPIASGDADCNGQIDIADVTRIIQYLFLTNDPLCDACL